MKIIKYRYLSASKYEITFDDRKIILYEDIILKYNILTMKDISSFDIDKFLSENKYYELYYKALSYVKYKMRSEKEIVIYLKKYTTNNEYIDLIISDFKQKNIIDENLYAKSFINDCINLKDIGPNKIRNELISSGIDLNVIDSNLSLFTKELIDNKISKYVNKEFRLNKKSFLEFKNKVINNLLNKGYNKSDILDNLVDVSFDDSNLYQREYDKLYKKLSLKYSGKDLEYRVKMKLYANGFRK